jgi:hypothetical protein
MRLLTTLMLIACAVALQGCVTYSNPYEPAGRVQYGGEGAYDGYGYDEGETIVDLTIADAAYYPWWSVDYYYLGSHYYRPIYLRGPYYSLRYNFGYPPNFWPYYGFYSPFYYPYSSYAWYDPWTGFPRYGIGLDFPWLDVYWARRYRDHVREHYDPGYDQYGNSRSGYQLSRGEVLTDARDRAYPSERLLGREAQAASREAWTAPSLGDADNGMQVRSRRERKIQESHIGPAPMQSPSAASPSTRVMSAPSQSWSAQPSAPVIAAPDMVRDVLPSQPSFTAPSRQSNAPAPATPAPRINRQVQPPPQARPSAPPRSAPSMPAPIRGPSDSGPSPNDKSGSKQKN